MSPMRFKQQGDPTYDSLFRWFWKLPTTRIVAKVEMMFKSHIENKKQHENDAMWYWWNISENSTAAAFSPWITYHLWAQKKMVGFVPYLPSQKCKRPHLSSCFSNLPEWWGDILWTTILPIMKATFTTHLTKKLPQNEFIFHEFRAFFWKPPADIENRFIS